MAMNRFLLSALVLASSSVHAASFVVDDIKIEGLQRVALGAALLQMPVRVGDSVSDQDISEVIESLYASGNYDDVQVFQDGNTLYVKVQERASIASISFSGNKAIKEEQLQENLEASGVRIGESLDRTQLSQIEKGLEDFYYSVGKYNATVKAVVTPLPRNRADLKFVFTEGVSAKIQQINIIGNEDFSDSELLDNFDLNADVSWWNFLSDDKYQKQVLAGDIEKLKSFYLDRGYLKFNVESTNVAISPDKKGVYITLNVNEGEQYTVKDVKFRGNLIDKQDEIKALIPFELGATYNGSQVTQLEEDVKKVLGESGYAYPKVQSIPEFDDINNEVTLNMQVDPGKRIYVRDIRFTGNNITKDEVLRREMRQMESTWLNSKSIEAGKTRLNRTGFFETVDVQTVRVPGSDDQVDLVYNVKEANSGSVNFGVGYGTESGVSFQVGLQQDNFLGTGNRIGINASTNDYQQNISLEYRDPYFTIDGVSLGGKVFYNKFEAEDAGIVDYTNESYGGSMSFGFPVDELNYLSLSAGYTHNKISNLKSYDQILKFIEAQKSAGNVDDEGTLEVDDFDLTLSWTRNNLDKGYFPTAGNHQRAYIKATLPGSDTPYYKMQYDGRQYFPLNNAHSLTLLFRGRLGYGNGYGSEDGNDNIFPFYENFYAGGFSTIRGYDSNTVGPKAVYTENNTTNNGTTTATDEAIGGNATMLGSVELFFPMPFMSDDFRNSLRTSVFFDAASVWDTEFDYTNSDIDSGGKYYYDYSDPWNFRYSAGVAVQWVSPLGPLVFSLATPINSYDGDEEEVFTFTIGQTF